jgi:hypothetical protein
LVKHELLKPEKMFRIENNYKNVINLESDVDEESEEESEE